MDKHPRDSAHSPEKFNERPGPGLKNNREVDVSDLGNLFDLKKFQSVMESFSKATGLVTAVLDLEGRVLVATGWQEICTRFHRAHPESAKSCTQSDLYLSSQMKAGEFAVYKCRNQLWDGLTPLMIEGRHVGNLYTGQFFYDDENIDMGFFSKQAEKYGYDKKAYLNAVAKVPRIGREKAKQTMRFLSEMADYLAQLGLSSLRIAGALEEQKKTEKILRKQEKKYRLLFDEVLSGFALHEIVVDENKKPVDYTFLEVNAAFEALTGLDRRQILNKRATQVLPGIEKDPFDFIGKYGKVALTGESLRFDQYMEQIDSHYSVEAFSPEKGRFAVLFKDISDLKKAEAALKSSEDRFKKALENIPDVIVIYDTGLKIKYINGAARKITGKPAAFFTGSRDEDIWPPDIYDTYVPALKEARDTGRVRTVETSLTIPDMGTRYLSITCVPLLGEDGKTREILGVTHDLTGYKAVEDAMRTHKDDLESLVAERTRDLQKMVNFMADREIRMADLKKEIAALRAQIDSLGGRIPEKDNRMQDAGML